MDRRIGEAKPNRSLTALDNDVVPPECPIRLGKCCAENRGLRAQLDRRGRSIERPPPIDPVHDTRPLADEGSQRCGSSRSRQRFVEPSGGSQLARLVKLDRTGEFVA